LPDIYSGLKKIGEGGTAEVYLASKKGRATPLVLKIFTPEIDLPLIEREYNVAQAMHFPGVLTIFQKGETEQRRHFLEMEYCPGQVLEDVIGHVTEEQLLSLLSALTASLHVMHSAGYLHNDLKPSNVFLPTECAGGSSGSELYYLKLADFSLATPFEEGALQSVTGTVGYMSPEMIQKRTLTPASDLFSLGVLGYYLACGVMPFVSETNDPLEINAAVTEGERPSFTGPGAEFSSKTIELITGLLAISPEKRPSSAFGLLEDLSRAGSAYPFRQAIRPRHLLPHRDIIAPAELERLFGQDSFSPDHFTLLESATGMAYAPVRMILEHNFDRGNFARLNGRWGWRDSGAAGIEWPRQVYRYGLRPLSGTPYSCKKFCLAAALSNSPEDIHILADQVELGGGPGYAFLSGLSAERQKLLLYCLRAILSKETRRRLSNRIARILEQVGGHPAETGRLYHDAGAYDKAIDFLVAAAREFSQQHDHEHALDMLEMAITAVGELGDAAREVEILLEKARLFKDQGLYKQAMVNYNDVIDIAHDRGAKKIVAVACKELGDIYKAISDFPAGIRTLKRAMSIYEELNDRLEVSHTLNNIGNIYWIDGKLDESLVQYTEALKIQTELDSQKDIASSLSNMGSIYLMQGKIGIGIDCLNRSLVLKEKLGDKGEIARSWNNIGVANFLAGNMNKAVDSYIKSLEYNREIGDKNEQLFNIENLAETMLQAGRLNDALAYLRDGTAMSEDLDNDFHRCDIARLTGMLLNRMGYYDDAEAQLLTSLEKASGMDNSQELLACRLGLARLYMALREYDDCGKHLDSGIALARSLGDKHALFHLLLIKFAQKDDDVIYAEIATLADELETEREHGLRNLSLLERSIRNQAIDDAAGYLEKAGEYFNSRDEDIDRARFELAAAEYYRLSGDPEHATAYCRRAMIQAKAINILPELWQAGCCFSEILFAQKEFEQSFAHARQTIEIIKKITSKIKDQDRQGRLFNDKRIINLLGRIKSLQSVLGGKKGAAVSNPSG